MANDAPVTSHNTLAQIHSQMLHGYCPHVCSVLCICEAMLSRFLYQVCGAPCRNSLAISVFHISL